ncbi:MAG: sodium:solute symporter family protein [Bacillota bacterium]
MGAGGWAILCVAIYLVILITIGWVAGKKSKTSTDYMVAGRKMPLYMTTATLFATYVCGGTIMGGAGAAYSGGFFSTIYDPFAAAVALIIAGLFIMKFIRETRIVSMGSFYRIRYGESAGTLSSICMVPTYILFATVQIMAIGKTFSAIMGWDYMTMALVGGILVILYTYWGGMMAVAWTDFFQSMILIIGVIVLFPLALNATGGMTNVKEVVPPEYLSFAPRDYSIIGILTYIAMWAGCGLGNIPCPDLMQRAMVAKDGKTAKWSGVLSGLLMIGLGLLVVYMGVFGIQLVHAGVLPADAVNSDPEMLVPLMAMKLMHPVILGIFLVGLCGAIMSSADSALFAPAAIFSNDLMKEIYKRRGKEISDEQLKKYTQWSVLILGILAMLLAISSVSLYDIMILGFTLLGQMLFFPLILGVYWKRANEYGALAGMIAGAIVPLFMMLTQGTMFPGPEWVATLIPLAASALATVAVSLATQSNCPPKPLKTIDGEIIKWPELEVKSNVGQAPSL